MIVSSPIQKSVRYKKLERSHFYQADFWSQTGRKRCERGHGIETHVKTVTVGILGQLMHKKMPQTGRQRCGRLMDLKKPGKSDLSQAYYNGHFFEWASWQSLEIWVQLVQKSVRFKKLEKFIFTGHLSPFWLCDFWSQLGSKRCGNLKDWLKANKTHYHWIPGGVIAYGSIEFC